MGEYSLKCPECGVVKVKEFEFSCPAHDAMLKSVYTDRRIKFRKLPSIWRFHDWLPTKGISNYEGKSITYKSEQLCRELGLKNLYIAFNGYWPEKNAVLKTCTFKELEAVVTIQYAKESGINRLVVASAGNTANAFAHIASREDFPVVLVVPKKCLCDIFVPELDASVVRTVIIENGDYSDAISIAKHLSAVKGFTYEGGARNIARRDGLATVLLDAVQEMKKLPEHYFQAVGSGTGAMAAWEAAERLLNDGRFGKALPKLHLSQNLPFVPMVKAWRERRREITEKDMPAAENILDIVYARVLSNRYPSYAVRGGVYDALNSTNGEMYEITNQEAQEASKLFESLEGIDILPAAGVAVASLIKAVDEGKVNHGDRILLNITGGGKKRLQKEIALHEIKADIVVSKNISHEELKEATL